MIREDFQLNSDLPDKSLLEQVKAGHYGAFELLFERYYNQLCNYASHLLGESFDSEDIVQDIFVRIWEKRNSLNFIDSIKSYLYTSVKNSCLNYKKADSVRQGYVSISRLTEPEFTDDVEVEQEEFRYQLFLCIDKLPSRCREVFFKSRFDLSKQQEIAEDLSISIKTVKAQIGKALKYLKLCLETSYPEYFSQKS